MKTHWISNNWSSLNYVIMAAVIMLTCFGCEQDFVHSTQPADTNILVSEDYWVDQEGISLIALEGYVFLEFPAGVVTSPTLFTVSLVDLEDQPNESYNSMNQGISIINSIEDLVFGDFVNIRLNYAMESFQGSPDVNEDYLTIFKKETIGSLSETQVSIGECCVDCSRKTVSGCISECGLYMVGELYLVYGI